MKFKFSGINIYSKKPEVVFEFYKKLGFREVALRKYYYGDEDAILMEKQVM